MILNEIEEAKHCEYDPVYYMESQVRIYDYRQGKHASMKCYDKEKWAIDVLRNSIFSGKDVLIKKKRDVGATTILIALSDWFWRFNKSFILWMSRREDFLDESCNCHYTSKMSHLDLIEERLPSYLMVQRERSHLRVKNLETGSIISGESYNNKKAGRGGRYTAAILDDFAIDGDCHFNAIRILRQVTRCIVFVFDVTEGEACDASDILRDGHASIDMTDWRPWFGQKRDK